MMIIASSLSCYPVKYFSIDELLNFIHFQLNCKPLKNRLDIR